MAGIDDARLFGDAIHRLLPDILDDVEFQYLRPELIKANIFTMGVLERIEAKECNRDRVFELMTDAVPRLGPQQRLQFLEILGRHYSHIVTSLQGEYEESKRKSQLLNSNQTTAASQLPHHRPTHAAGQPSPQPATTKACSGPTSHQALQCHSGKSVYAEMRARLPGRVYAMDSPVRGLALIINNQNFKVLPRRKWSEIDADKLYHMFKYLGFQVSLEEDKTTQAMLDLMKGLARFDKLREVSALAVVLLSHGGSQDVVYGADGREDRRTGPQSGTYITKLQLMDMFKQENCPVMQDKPKLFVVQSCRGGEEDKPPPAPIEAADSLALDVPSEPESRGDKGRQSKMPRRVAAMSDMCFVHSSSLGYRAYRQRHRGSPFVDVFTQCVREKAAVMEFRDIVQEVQHRMKDSLLPSQILTLPDLSSQLTNQWYLNPPPPHTVKTG